MASRQRYQKGSLSKQPRANCPDEWILRYRVTLPDGRRVQRHEVIGTVADYPTKSQAERAADQVRIKINSPTAGSAFLTVGAAATHYMDTELLDSNEYLDWSTKKGYRSNIDLYILPRWEKARMMDVETIAVEAWLKGIRGKKGEPLANPTKEKIRRTFSVLYTHAARHKLIPADLNPILLVRQSGKRSRVPDILEPGELHELWFYSEAREQAAIAVEGGNGLRVSEGFALKWHDISWDEATALVNKKITSGRLGKVKTIYSEKLVPLHPHQLEALRAWREVTPYRGDDDWVFASPRSHGAMPYWPDMILRRCIQPLAKRLGINKRIGWHTFRRTFTSLLTKNKEAVKVVQDLARHASPGTTFGLYAQSFTEDMRKAQGKVVEMVHEAPVRPLPRGRKALPGATV